jgi:hypothetical protein
VPSVWIKKESRKNGSLFLWALAKPATIFILILPIIFSFRCNFPAIFYALQATLFAVIKGNLWMAISPEILLAQSVQNPT